MTITPTLQPPLSPESLRDALRPFGESTMLPRAAYTSADVFDWEQRAFLAGSWFCLGRRDEVLPDATTHHAVTVGGIPVLVTTDVSGEVRALANTCRHRGHELLAAGESSDRRALVCPYHAWSYRLDGDLLVAPGFEEVSAFDPAQHSLAQLPLREWHGWLFVNASGDADAADHDFEAHLGGLGDLVAPYRPERLVRLASHDYVVAANWKVVTENYHECYHCPLIHPELCQVSPPTSGDNYDLPGAWVGGSMDLREHAQTMSFDGTSGGPLIGGADPRKVLYLGLFPNLLLSLHPDYVMTHQLVPLDAGRTEVTCSWYFPDAGTDPAYAVDFWDRTNRQDWAACESVQRGLWSPHYRPGPLAPSEDAVHLFVTMVANGYLEGAVQTSAGPV